MSNSTSLRSCQKQNAYDYIQASAGVFVDGDLGEEGVEIALFMCVNVSKTVVFSSSPAVPTNTLSRSPSSLSLMCVRLFAKKKSA